MIQKSQWSQTVSIEIILNSVKAIGKKKSR